MSKAVIFLIVTAAAAAAASPQPAFGRGQDSRSVAVDVGSPAAPKTSEAPPQIPQDNQNATSAAQLTSARSSSEPVAQSSREPRSADAPQDIAPRSEGRSAQIDRIAGSDRCDPAQQKSRLREECRQVIETRASDYSKPAATELSPEQRLLIAEQWGPSALDVTSSRLVKSGTPDDRGDGLAIASIVLQQETPAKQDNQKPAEDPAANSAVQAIIQVLTQGTPR